MFVGISGLQWKHHFGKQIEVTINDFSKEACSEIRDYCQLNAFTIRDYTIQDTFTKRNTSDSPREVILSNNDANVVLHQSQHHFMYE